ncbi:GNAT family N-acetyltransferase [Mesorhizobium sp. B2-3-4]|nr:GNAT family N-acetyltransferase [Mesorhizobium sp. B2-3-4]
MATTSSSETAPAIVFLPARQGDAEAIAEMVRAAYARWIPVIGREPRPMTVDYHKALNDNDFTLAYLGDNLAGLIETIAHGDHLWIENVAVEPQYQGRGIGGALLRHAEEKALAAGLREMRLLTNESFATNVVLYEKLGYVTDRREPFMNGITLYMSKQLA